MSGSTSRIAQTFAELKSRGQMAFMPFVTAGDPDLAATQQLLRELANRGVDLIEVGFPYSDPIADGPVIQASYQRALNQKLKVVEIFAAIGQLPTAEMPPLVAMVSYAIVFRHGVSQFVQEAKQAGFAGLIIPDLPGDEGHEVAMIAQRGGLDLIQLVAPTTPRERVRKILQSASGFVYCIAVAGTTGVRKELPAELREQLQWLRQETTLPLAVGFGVSRPDQVDELRGLADGVIVGSALVRLIGAVSEQQVPFATALQNAGELATAMVAATRG